MEETHRRQPEIKPAARRVLVLTQRPSSAVENLSPASTSGGGGRRKEEGEGDVAAEGRERLKRHREEVAGKVAVPEIWGNEDLLKEWMDYAAFDKLLAPAGLASAREALAAEGRRVGGGGGQRLRIESRCC